MHVNGLWEPYRREWINKISIIFDERNIIEKSKKNRWEKWVKNYSEKDSSIRKFIFHLFTYNLTMLSSTKTVLNPSKITFIASQNTHVHNTMMLLIYICSVRFNMMTTFFFCSSTFNTYLCVFYWVERIEWASKHFSITSKMSTCVKVLCCLFFIPSISALELLQTHTNCIILHWFVSESFILSISIFFFCLYDR